MDEVASPREGGAWAGGMEWLLREDGLEWLDGRGVWDLRSPARSILQTAFSDVEKRGSQMAAFMFHLAAFMFQRMPLNCYGMRGRGHSPINAVRVLPQWGQHGLSAPTSLSPRSWLSSVSASWPITSSRSAIFTGPTESLGVCRINSSHARCDKSRFEGCHRP